MLVKGPDGFLPIQNTTAARRTATLGGGTRASKQDSRYDHISLSVPEEDRNFREAVANLSSQVRITTTTGKIQELRSQVSSGEYEAVARETAARILLLEEGE